MPKYNAHFVPVKYSGRMHCVTGQPLPLDTDYQAAVEGVASEAALVPACQSRAFLTLFVLLCSGS
jgi:hypothetical protein